MDNKQIYHICGEAIVIAGLSAYFIKQLKKANEEIEQLKKMVEDGKKENDKVFSTIFSILDQHLNNKFPPQMGGMSRPVQEPEVQATQNDQQLRKRRVSMSDRSPQIQMTPKPSPQVVPQEEEDDILANEMKELLEETEEVVQEVIPTIDITNEDVSAQDAMRGQGAVLVMMTSEISPMNVEESVLQIDGEGLTKKKSKKKLSGN